MPDKLKVPKEPKIICMCGSTRFKEYWQHWMKWLTYKGFIVISVHQYTQAEGLTLTRQQKRFLDALHLKRIEASDAIFVVNVGGYIGRSTRKEIAWAMFKGKNIYYAEPPVEGLSHLPKGEHA